MQIYLFLIVLVLSLKFTKKEIEQIKKTGIIKVKGSSESADYETQQKCCFSIEAMDKNKRKGYTLIKNKFQKIKKYLVAKNIIPQGHSLKPTQQVVRMNHNRKQWNFKRIICFLTENKEGQIQNTLQKQGIKYISFHPTQELDQFDLLMKAFNDAKKKAEVFLDQIQYKIKKVGSVSVLNNLQLQSFQETIFSRIQSAEQSSESESEQEKQRQQKNSIQNGPHHVEVEVTFLVQSLDQWKEESSSEGGGVSALHEDNESSEQDHKQEL